MIERRLSPRRPAQLRATVVCDDGLRRIPALVMDESEAGVRIRMDDEETIETGCYLLFANRMEPFRLVWQASRSAGLAFIDT